SNRSKETSHSVWIVPALRSSLTYFSYFLHHAQIITLAFAFTQDTSNNFSRLYQMSIQSQFRFLLSFTCLDFFACTNYPIFPMSQVVMIYFYSWHDDPIVIEEWIIAHYC